MRAPGAGQRGAGYGRRLLPRAGRRSCCCFWRGCCPGCCSGPLDTMIVQCNVMQNVPLIYHHWMPSCTLPQTTTCGSESHAPVQRLQHALPTWLSAASCVLRSCQATIALPREQSTGTLPGAGPWLQHAPAVHPGAPKAKHIRPFCPVHTAAAALMHSDGSACGG